MNDELNSQPVRHIVSLSGGKDSTALAIYLRDRIPYLEYVFRVSASDCTKLTLKTQKSLLQNKNLDDELRRLEVERLELEHRERLREILPRIKSYIENCRWAQEASTIGGSTHHITVKHNQLFEELVTKRYIQLFEQTLADMGRPLKVKIETRGRKGQTVKQVILEASKSARNIAKPEKVLSEGEKRAVALTDFLTEVALDTTSSGIILDDPVTSLDLEWRETIATILVREAKRRQVIVFTHDMPFLYYLKSYADDVGIQTESHWIKRGDFDNKPGYVYLNNCPALEKDYRKASRARELCELAKKADAAAQQAILKEGFGALRTSYEAFVVFEVLNEVVMRFNERISIGRLTGIVWDPSLIKDVDESYARISRYIEGHLHSDQMSAKVPSPELLLQEIERFNSLRKNLAQLKN